ncbi:MAG: hypothetical protein WDN31_11710 [Hyphomicrobium sp.]
MSALFEDAGLEGARWVRSADAGRLEAFLKSYRTSLAEDRYGTPVYLIRDRWSFGVLQKDWPQIEFATTRERG